MWYSCVEIPTHWTRRKPSGGLFIYRVGMPIEPADKRTIAFFDGQNLFHAARAALGYTFPNYDPIALATAVCKQQGWPLAEARFYTRLPHPDDTPLSIPFCPRTSPQPTPPPTHVHPL